MSEQIQLEELKRAYEARRAEPGVLMDAWYDLRSRPDAPISEIAQRWVEWQAANAFRDALMAKLFDIMGNDAFIAYSASLAKAAHTNAD